MDNEISPEGKYTIMIRKGRKNKPEEHYWSNYMFEGHLLKMDNPKKGQLVRLPFGELVKITHLGTEMIVNPSHRRTRTQFPAVYVVQVPG